MKCIKFFIVAIIIVVAIPAFSQSASQKEEGEWYHYATFKVDSTVFEMSYNSMAKVIDSIVFIETKLEFKEGTTMLLIVGVRPNDLRVAIAYSGPYVVGNKNFDNVSLEELEWTIPTEDSPAYLVSTLVKKP